MIAFSIFKHAKDNIPGRGEASWDQFVDQFRTARTAKCTLANCERSDCRHKTKTLAWCPATWPVGATRAKKTVEAVHVLVLDLDHQTDLQPIRDALAGLRHILHASHSDRPADRCVRAIALTRPLTADEWPRFWIAATQAVGLTVDESTKDASRIYFAPSRPIDADYEFSSLDGESLDVDAILATAPAEPIPVPRVAPTLPVPATDTPEDDTLAAAAVLARAWPAGGRHRASLALCGALARAGWDADRITDFVSAVCELQETGNGDEDKRRGHAERSIALVEAGENVAGWPRLIEILGEPAVQEARDLLGLSPGMDDAALAALLDVPAAEITQTDVRAALRAISNGMVRSTAEERVAAGELVKRVLHGEPVGVTPDAARAAIELVVKNSPPEASANAVAEVLVKSLPHIPIDTLVKLVEHFREKYPAEPSTVNEDNPPATDAELRGFLTMGTKKPEPSGPNIELVLRWASDLRGHTRFNVLTKQIEISGAFKDEAPNDVDIAIKNWLDRKWGVATTTTEVGQQLLRVARRWGSYDPVAEYLNGLVWDRVPRLDTWLVDYCQALPENDAEYVKLVGARYLISAAARALAPGSKVDTVLVLEGEQGAKKSTAFRVLGGEWFTATPIVMGDKDSRMLAASKWICELAELASIVRSDVESQKAFLSQEADDFRPPYGRVIESFKRRCVFAGTVNPTKDGDVDYLKDDTGNRRWWAVRIGDIDEEALRRDRDQLWAEAVYRYKSASLNQRWAHPRCPGERWWFEKSEQAQADAVVESRSADNPWTELVADWVRVQERIPTGTLGAAPGSEGAPRGAWTLPEIAKGALGIEARDLHRHSKVIGSALRACGLEKKQRRVGKGARAVLWSRAGITVEDGDEDEDPERADSAQAPMPGTVKNAPRPTPNPS